jgi:hypothetical protein
MNFRAKILRGVIVGKIQHLADKNLSLGAVLPIFEKYFWFTISHKSLLFKNLEKHKE